ncbi:transglycosylase domain-containing protein [Flavimaricola marinus]|uniref:transglycosylase domain-containing protein n=1 Tax=Flavimaricola marinus TaxID=1819565 RepID=UPI001B3B3F86|nr:transglycosylase domain-containing protein [Flavimaricola marinus]
MAAALFVGYGYTGYRDARADAQSLEQEANALIAAGQGGVALGVDRRAILLAVEDPAFGSHYGVDFTTPGAGATTITQSLAKSDGFADFTPGLHKIRQSGYAIGLEAALTKPQILALFLNRVPMGAGPDGTWIDGLYAASEAHFGASPSDVPLDAFLKMVAVMIAPGALKLADVDAPELIERAGRIAALVEEECEPASHSDVWLEGCDL